MVPVDIKTCLKAWKSSRIKLQDGSTFSIRVAEEVKLDYVPSVEIIVG